MSAIVAEPAYSAELIGGIEVQKPVPKKLHAIVQARLLTAPAKWQKSHGIACVVLSELDVLCGKDHADRLIPNITVAPKSALHRGSTLRGRRCFVSKSCLPDK